MDLSKLTYPQLAERLLETTNSDERTRFEGELIQRESERIDRVHERLLEGEKDPEKLEEELRELEKRKIDYEDLLTNAIEGEPQARVQLIDRAAYTHLLKRGTQGDVTAYHELLTRAWARLQIMVQMKLRQNPGLHRWEQTDDVLQEAALKLDKAAKKSGAADKIHSFMGLAATTIKNTLYDLNSRHFEAQKRDAGKNESASGDSRVGGGVLESIAAGSEPLPPHIFDLFLNAVDKLPEEEEEVFHLSYFVGLTQTEICVETHKTRAKVQKLLYQARDLIVKSIKRSLDDS
ncbi:MAG: sigma-70 family RNA polymerase sigma factor [Pirellulaceae bacterium]|jgi:RNA polymerase sigma-70 factor (ECF subfamily)|nr:sigma-70 family RNA polymerase sigma factor [Pirellulaceae bacterium]